MKVFSRLFAKEESADEAPHPVSSTRPVTGRQRRAIRCFRVTVVDGPNAGMGWKQPAERCAIGSHPSNDLVIEDPTVSRFHCELVIAGDAVRVRDLGSRNGTLFGAVQLSDALMPGDTVLQLGKSTVRIVVDAEQTELAASERSSFGPLIGETELMREVFQQLERAAASDITLLVEGETGTGKEGVAAAVHEASARREGPFVVVDCSAIPANLLESELFGHGAFELAKGGTLFLDEIGELPLDIQPKILRAIESREIRIVAATNRDLRTEVNSGKFRADLYFRLAVLKIVLPPLRDRAADIAPLVRHLLAEMGAAPDAVAELTAPEFVAALTAARWPGNVRELRNHLEQCVVFGERRLPDAIAAPHPTNVVDPSLPYEVARRQAVDAFERDYVTGLLERMQGNVAAAARAGGLNRAYLYRLVRRHGIR
jgi:DNA-binding NtrC family response regulator